MLTKTKIALVAALVAGSATVASAQGFDPNPANRYPMYANPGGQAMPYLGYAAAPQATAPQGVVSRNVSAQRTSRGIVSHNVSAQRGLRSAPVALRQGNAARSVGESPVYFGSQQQDGFQVDINDRASSPYAGGVN
jgi:hypothetical protein